MLLVRIRARRSQRYTRRIARACVELFGGMQEDLQLTCVNNSMKRAIKRWFVRDIHFLVYL